MATWTRRQAALRELAEANAALPGRAPLATVSAKDIARVTPVDVDALGADSSSRPFHRFAHRCGTCHAAPDPSMHTRPEWRVLMSRMAGHMGEAGLIPLDSTDYRLIGDFLESHSR